MPQLFLKLKQLMLIKKQDIFELPIENWSGFGVEELETAVKAALLKHHHTWILPQLVAWFGTWNILEDGKATVLANCDTKLKKVLYMLTRINRSALIPVQTKAPDYGAFTPLILMGLKRMAGRSYESWRNYPGLEWLMERRLMEAVSLEYSLVDCYGLGSARLLEIREQGLTGRTGKVAGVVKPAESTYLLNGIKDTELGHLPQLTQTIVTQCWLAHPKARTPYMILDPDNWDRMPDPLISTEIFKPAPVAKPVVEKAREELPWD